MSDFLTWLNTGSPPYWFYLAMFAFSVVEYFVGKSKWKSNSTLELAMTGIKMLLSKKGGPAGAALLNGATPPTPKDEPKAGE